MLAMVYTFIAFSGFSKPQRLFWSVFLFMFLLNDFTSILFKSSLVERWLQFFFSIVNVVFGIWVIRHINRYKELFPTHIKPVIIIYVLFAAGAIPANITGCVMLCKSLNTGAVYAVLAAQTFYTCSKIFIEIVYLHHEAYKEHRLASYFDFYKIQESLQQILKIVAVFCWLIVMFRNLNFFDFVYNWSVAFLSKQRTLGDNTFAFGSIFIFLLVIWFSSFISKFITVLFNDNSVAEKNRKSRWGSMLILLRLAILAAGVIIAFAASGIPMDKLTIIIGALGVGIGFGLQNIVNNLVSGVILAFEKPIQKGDAIEIGNRYGIVKEIGIRSSKLLTADGSLIIIPNGDLLSQHIINWTLNTHIRRVELFVGVAYKSELSKTEEILRAIINAQDDIEKIPLPQILAHQFAESAVEFRVLFWCDIDKWIAVKSEVLIKIHQAFTANGIEIPFPQRDINIKNAAPAERDKEK